MRADLTTLAIAAGVLYYNLVFVAPLTAPVVIRVARLEKTDAIFQRIGAFSETWSKRIIVTVLTILGAVLLIDAAGFFLGHPLIRYPGDPPS